MRSGQNTIVISRSKWRPATNSGYRKQQHRRVTELHLHTNPNAGRNITSIGKVCAKHKDCIDAGISNAANTLNCMELWRLRKFG